MASRGPQVPYLSFSEALIGGLSFIPGAPDVEVPEFEASVDVPLKLANTWVLWEQPSSTQSGARGAEWSIRKVCEFSTVQEFWSIWNGLPQPSELIEGKKFSRTGQNNQTHTIEAFMIFKQGIQPEWEDQANAKGGHFQLTLKATTPSGQVDEYWNNIVLAIIGNNIEACKVITGVRLVDKLSAKAKVTDHIRIELWYHSTSTTDEVNQLKRSMEKMLITRLDGSAGSALRADSIIDKKHNQMK
eukprot:TRINITY_DN20980_c0_g1_i1.p2 TRINITY_DN20980_c0_g1~~TRINITY_DN20980_c0_g1_i1.p2  ORF type:complete len:244 (+),score=55.04 TRINITY_DN20980_c0_g1_i1:186-917(+)